MEQLDSFFICAFESVLTFDLGESRLTVTSQDEVVLVQLLLHELTAGGEDVSALLGLFVQLLLCKLLAGDALGDVPHPSLAAAPHWCRVAVDCPHRDTGSPVCPPVPCPSGQTGGQTGGSYQEMYKVLEYIAISKN